MKNFKKLPFRWFSIFISILFFCQDCVYSANISGHKRSCLAPRSPYCRMGDITIEEINLRASLLQELNSTFMFGKDNLLSGFTTKELYILRKIVRFMHGHKEEDMKRLKDFICIALRDGFWADDRESVLKILENISANDRKGFRYPVTLLDSFLSDINIQEALSSSSRESFCLGKKDEVLEVLDNIFANPTINITPPVKAFRSFIKTNGESIPDILRERYFWTSKSGKVLVISDSAFPSANEENAFDPPIPPPVNDNIERILSNKGSFWTDKKDKISKILENISVNAGHNITNALRTLECFLKDKVIRKALSNKGPWHGKKNEILEMLHNISANAGINTDFVIGELSSFLLDRKICDTLSPHGFWNSRKDKIIEILINITANAVRNTVFDTFAIGGYKNFLVNSAIQNALSKRSIWRGEQDKILEILYIISTNTGIDTDSAISELGSFLEDKNVQKTLSENRGFWNNKKDEVFKIIINILISTRSKKGCALDALRFLLGTTGFNRSPTREKLIDNTIRECLFAPNRIAILNNGLFNKRLYVFPGESMIPYFTLGILSALFPEENILDRTINHVISKDGQIDLLVHPIGVAFVITGDMPISLSLKPKRDLKAEHPVLNDSTIEKLPIVDNLERLGLPCGSTLVTAGRNIQTQDYDTGKRWNLKLLRHNESPTDLNFEAWAYGQIKLNPTGYTGIIPEVLRPEGMAGDVYLVKIPKKLVSVDSSQTVFTTSDSYHIGFAYKAEDGYFDYGENGFPTNDMKAWFRNLAVLAKRFGLIHSELISLFHDKVSKRRYSENNVPAGCVDDIVSAVRYSNTRGDETIADFGLDHMGDNLCGSLRKQLFGLILVVADRMHKQNASIEEFAYLLREGLKSYCEIILEGDNAGIEYINKEILGKINYYYYAMHILYGFENKQSQGMGQGRIDLGYDNSALSIHGLVDLVDLVSLGILRNVVRSRPPHDSPRACSEAV